MNENNTENDLRSVNRTHAGLVRGNNEDAYGEAPELGLLILADGMGGYNAGEIASAIAIDTMLEYLRLVWPAEPDLLGDDGLRADSSVLKDSIVVAHEAIRSRAKTEPQYAGMGTTVVACIIRRDSVSVAHVGDSRLYRLRGNHLQRLTLDHSLLEELVARGHYSRAEAEHLVRKNIVTRALGVDSEIEVEINEYDSQPGDIYLLCSDGLSDMLDDAAIEETMIDMQPPLSDIADRLLAMALEAGGRDNVTVALARFGADSPARPDGLMGRIKRFFGPENPASS